MLFRSASGFSFNIGDLTGMTMARTVDPNGDMDGDGFRNLDEVRAGSSPLDPLSFPITLTASSPPRIGTTFNVSVDLSFGAGRAYFLPWSLNPAPFPLRALNVLDGRWLPLHYLAVGSTTALDPIYQLSTSGTYPGVAVFPDGFGIMDNAGHANVRVLIPNLPSIIGTTIHAGCVILEGSAINGVQMAATPFSATLIP